MNNLIFLTNNLQNPHIQKDLRIPLDFVCFGILKAKMYKYFGNNDTFITITDKSNQENNVVYGGIFLCKDFDFYSRILDSFYLCSLSVLLRNHANDICHRVKVEVTPIYFNTLNELARLQYQESEETIQVETYIANLSHPKIKKRITDYKNSYRIMDGIDAINFKKLFWEVQNESNHTDNSI